MPKPKTKKSRSTLKQAPRQAPPDKALKRRFLTVEELRAILKLAARRSLRDHALILLMYDGGLRREEIGILRLNYAEDMHKTGRIYLHRGKGSKSVHVALSANTRKLLIKWITKAYKGKKRKPEDFIFPGQSEGRGITGRTVYNIYNYYATQLGLPEELRHPHVLKRTVCQHLIEEMVRRGKDPWNALQAIAERVGHASAMTTIQNYISQSGDEKQLAQDIMKGILG